MTLSKDYPELTNLKKVAEPEITPITPSNPYMNMPIEKVRKDAHYGVKLAKEALEAREVATAEVAPVTSEITKGKDFTLKKARLENLRRGRQVMKERREKAKQEAAILGTNEVKAVTQDNNGKNPRHSREAMSVKLRTWREWLYVGAGIALFLSGIVLIILGNVKSNAFLIVVGAFMASAGGFGVYRGWSQSSLIYGSRKTNKVNANVLNIAASNIQFTYETDESQLMGIPQRCLNDGKFYFVFINGLNGNGSRIPLVLPDLDPNERYYDPREAINCLRMELVRRFVNYLPSSTQVVSMVVIGVIVGIEVIALIALGG